ncbi:MAG: AsmA family protein, partial [Bacteroidota bacterium]
MLKTFIKWLSLTVVTILVGVTLAVYLYKDQIIEQVLAEINKSLKIAVTVEKIDLDLLHGFPNIAVQLTNASLPDVEGNSLLEAGEIYIVLNPFNLIKNDHTIERLDIEEATVRILFDEHNKSNFQNLIESTGEESDKDSLSNLSLNAISLTNVRVDY